MNNEVIDALRAEAIALGLKPHHKWSEQTLRAEIARLKPAEETAVVVEEEERAVVSTARPPAIIREKTLHELNLEARFHDRAIREQNLAAAEAAKAAVIDTLNEKRPDGKRMMKNLRG